MSSSLPTVVVFGATGQQGGSVARSLLESGKFQVVGVTRTPSSNSAQALEKLGAKLISADLSDQASLVQAFKSAQAWAVFGMTNAIAKEILWAGKQELEEVQGKNLVDAAQEASVEYLVWSSLPDAKAISGGKIIVPHFDHKAAIQRYAERKLKTDGNAAGTKLITVLAPSFLENYINFGGPRPAGDGKSFVLAVPNKATIRLPYYSAQEDTGRYVSWILSNPSKFVGQTIPMAAEELDYNEVVAAFSKVFGKTVNFYQLPEEEMRKHVPKPLADRMLPMYEFFDAHGYGFALSSDAEVRSKATKLEDWLKGHKSEKAFEALIQ